MSDQHRPGAGTGARRVIVLNQFALPRSQGGGTRHVELFGSLPRWSYIILAGARNHMTQQVYSRCGPGFVTVSVPPSNGGPAARLWSWAVYVGSAIIRTRALGPIDVVYASTPHLFAPVAGAWIASRRGIPFVVEVRDLWPKSVADASVIDPKGTTYRLLERLERWVYARADAIVAVTSGWEDHFERCGVPRAKVTVVPNGAAVGDFDVSASRAELRCEWGVTGFTAIFAGAHGPKDGIDRILDAAAVAQDVKFLLVGSGPSKAAAQERVRREGLANVVLRDPVPKRDLPRLLKACDVGIHAVTPLTAFENGMSPNKLFDYLAAGLPVVSNAQGPLRYVLGQGQCGVLGGPDSLAASLERVRGATPAERTAWGEAGPALVHERYSREVQATRLADVLDSVALPGRGTRVRSSRPARTLLERVIRTDACRAALTQS